MLPEFYKMVEIREVSKETAAIESEWVKDMPQWWQIVDGSLKAFSKGPLTKLGVFQEEELIAIYTLQEIGPKVIDAHLSCQRGVSIDVLCASAKTVKRRLLADGFRTIFLWPLRQNFGLIKIAKAVGFKETGVRMLLGKLGNKPAEWVQLGVNNVN